MVAPAVGCNLKTPGNSPRDNCLWGGIWGFRPFLEPLRIVLSRIVGPVTQRVTRYILSGETVLEKTTGKGGSFKSFRSTAMK